MSSSESCSDAKASERKRIIEIWPEAFVVRKGGVDLTVSSLTALASRRGSPRFARLRPFNSPTKRYGVWLLFPANDKGMLVKL